MKLTITIMHKVKTCGVLKNPSHLEVRQSTKELVTLSNLTFDFRSLRRLDFNVQKLVNSS